MSLYNPKYEMELHVLIQGVGTQSPLHVQLFIVGWNQLSASLSNNFSSGEDVPRKDGWSSEPFLTWWQRGIGLP
jgi:hypothetical protein